MKQKPLSEAIEPKNANSKMRLNLKKSSRKQPRKSGGKSNELKDEISLKRFAPSAIKLDRPFDAGLEGRNVGDLSEILQKLGKNQHAWSDAVVVREGTRISNEVVEETGTVLGMMDLYQFDMGCLKRPENYFCLKRVSDQMGHGLFAKRDIKKG